MIRLEGTKTADALRKAFAGESQAYNRYTYFAASAREAGVEHVADGDDRDAEPADDKEEPREQEGVEGSGGAEDALARVVDEAEAGGEAADVLEGDVGVVADLRPGDQAEGDGERGDGRGDAGCGAGPRLSGARSRGVGGGRGHWWCAAPGSGGSSPTLRLP